MTGFTAPRLGVAAVILTAVALLFVNSPVDGNFWWSDAPRHALNGAFVMDFIAAWPADDPKRWAIDYYLKYPALTILFYPPLFYVVEAAVYSLVGVTHLAAQATVMLFVVLLMAATFGLARQFLPRWSAVGAMLLVVGAPEVSFWARQVMLDVPAYAMVVAAAYFTVRFGATARTVDLAGGLCCTLAAVWIKLTSVFVLPVLVVALVAVGGVAVLRERRVVWAAFIGSAGLLPLVWLTMKYGRANIESVSGRPTDLPRFAWEAWLFYGRALPSYLGLPALVAAGIGVVSLVGRGDRLTHPRWLAWLLIPWLLVGYFFFSFIGVREPRHGIMMLLPLGLAGAAACQWWLPSRVAQAGALLLGLSTFGLGLVLRPAPEVNGYREVADYVAAHAPVNAVVLFHGARDGNFIYNMRARSGRSDITILRSDKLLLRLVAGERVRGVEQTDLTEVDIALMIRDLGVSLVVIQPGFWRDIRQMERFERIVESPSFTRDATFTITGNTPHQDLRIEVRRPTYPVDLPRRLVTIEMPMVGDVFIGKVGMP